MVILAKMANMVLVIATCFLTVTMAQAQDRSKPAGHIWVDVDQLGRPPFVQEMILLRLRGIYTRPVALAKTEQPALEGFRWMLIGKDEWSDSVENGSQVRGFQQVIAVFAQRSGNLVIPPFIQNLTYIDRSGARISTVIQTEPVTIRVAPVPTDASSWWLAAHSLAATDNWSDDPKDIDIGQSVKRSITITGVGVTDDQLPPRPEIKVPGLIVVPAAPVRKTVIGLGKPLKHILEPKKPGPYRIVEGREGPISSVTYSWTIRPVTGDQAILPAIEIPWYNTDANAMQRIVIPGRTVALKDTGPTLADMEQSLGIVGTPDSGRSLISVDQILVVIAFVTALLATLTVCSKQFREEVAGLSQRWQAYRAGLLMKDAAQNGDAARIWQLQRQLQGVRQSPSALGNLESIVFGKQRADRSALANIVGQLIDKEPPVD
jgi:hypothetical protein